ncbi:MAG: DNA replication and repair protein RecF [Treponema sp.]|jgi:DNA replication and repair protein RecF|nr:DNA replication and repair protein RecF [Treponema sp.]
MAVLSLRTAAFRNLADADTETGAKNVFLVGENGQGKTNFLEAVYFCSYGSSFRGVKDSELVRLEERAFSAAARTGSFEDSSFLNRQISVKYEDSKKTISLDGKKIEDRRDLLEASPCVVFCHEDMEFVSGTQERRRWFFDQTQSLYDLVYLDDLRRYRRILRTRNAVLKEAKLNFDRSPRTMEVLDALDPQLAQYGFNLMEKREAAARRFSVLFGPLYEEVSGLGDIGVVYGPSWKCGGPDEAAELLFKRREADMAGGLTLSGPHRDRYGFVRRGGEFAARASTGQRRLLALLLRAAQARCFSDMTGKTPVLLLDDVLLELDGEKRRRFLKTMPVYEQAFFTFLPEEPYQGYRDADTLTYTVKEGVIGP